MFIVHQIYGTRVPKYELREVLTLILIYSALLLSVVKNFGNFIDCIVGIVFVNLSGEHEALGSIVRSEKMLLFYRLYMYIYYRLLSHRIWICVRLATGIGPYNYRIGEIRLNYPIT